MRVTSGIVTKLQCLLGIRFDVQYLPDKALQLTVNPLRGLSVAELGR